MTFWTLEKLLAVLLPDTTTTHATRNTNFYLPDSLADVFANISSSQEDKVMFCGQRVFEQSLCDGKKLVSKPIVTLQSWTIPVETNQADALCTSREPNIHVEK